MAEVSEVAWEKQYGPRKQILSSFADLGARLRWGPVQDRRLVEMVTTIEGEILPRLMLSFQQQRTTVAVGLNESDRSAFLKLVLGASAHEVSRFVDSLIDRGVPLEEIFADLMAGTARRLGELWEADACDFADVTIGLCRLHEVLRQNSVLGDASFVRPDRGTPSVLLTTACGDQHVFGLLMVAEFFRRDGWRVWSEPAAEQRELCKILRAETIDMLGLSVSREVTAGALKGEIDSLRNASSNPTLQIFLGGPMVLENPGLVERVGADGWAKDAVSAPEMGRQMLAKARIDC